MAQYTTYTASVDVPVFAGWKCPHCSTWNLASGIINCTRSATTSSILSSRREAAESKAYDDAQSEWKQNAMSVISEMKYHPETLRNCLYLNNVHCKNCKKKAKWYKGKGYSVVLALSFLPLIISGFFAWVESYGEGSLIALLIFIAICGVTAFSFVMKLVCKNAIKKMPEEYLPVIGSENKELREYAQRYGNKLPSLFEILQTVGYDEATIRQSLNLPD